MKLEDLLGKAIMAAALCPRIDAIFLLGADRSICALAPDDEFAETTAAARFVSVQGSQALMDATITSVGGCSPISETLSDSRFTYQETYIETTKGRCTIITCLLGGKPNAAAPLVALSYRGYPPSDAVSLVDFARTAVPGRDNGYVDNRKETMQGVLPDVSAPARRSERTV